MIIDKNKYKTIIFDLGGVIINIDQGLTSSALQNLGLTRKEKLSDSEMTAIFDSFEKGEISSTEFRNILKQLSSPPVTDTEIDNAWNAMLLDIPKERIDLITTLNKTHSVFLLSNTNEIHLSAINAYLFKRFQIDDISKLFTRTYLSYRIGKRKPDPEIFKIILSENLLIPQETLFIDDSLQHIKSADSLGIQGYWLDLKKENIVELF